MNFAYFLIKSDWIQFISVYIDMGRGSANPVVLSVVSNGDRVTRKWKIKINMIPCNNLDMGQYQICGVNACSLSTISLPRVD